MKTHFVSMRFLFDFAMPGPEIKNRPKNQTVLNAMNKLLGWCTSANHKKYREADGFGS